jgi:hypothetical protein
MARKGNPEMLIEAGRIKLVMFLGSICGVYIIFFILRLIHSRCFVD